MTIDFTESITTGRELQMTIEQDLEYMKKFLEEMKKIRDAIPDGGDVSSDEYLKLDLAMNELTEYHVSILKNLTKIAMASDKLYDVFLDIDKKFHSNDYNEDADDSDESGDDGDGEKLLAEILEIARTRFA